MKQNRNKLRKVIYFFIIVATFVCLMWFAYTKGFILNSDSEKTKNDRLHYAESGEQISSSENSGDTNIVKISGSKLINDIEISNMQIVQVEKKKCEFIADVKNTTDKHIGVTNLRIKIVNENGEVDEIFGGGITELIPYEENKFKTIALADITDARDVIFEVIN